MIDPEKIDDWNTLKEEMCLKDSYVVAPNWYLTIMSKLSAVISVVLPVPLVCYQVAVLRAAETRLVSILPRRPWMLSPPVFRHGFSPVMAPKVEWKGISEATNIHHVYTYAYVWFFGGRSCLNTAKLVEFVKVNRVPFMNSNRWYAHCFRGLANHNILYMHPDSYFQSSSCHHCRPPNHFTTEENLSGDHPNRLSNASLADKVLREIQKDVKNII